jgi:hypothetical protein
MIETSQHKEMKCTEPPWLISTFCIKQTRQCLTNEMVQIGIHNGTAHIRQQCNKTAVLSCHRFLINSGVEKMNNI